MNIRTFTFYYQRAFHAMAKGNEFYIKGQYARATKWYKIANERLTQMGWAKD